MSTTILGTTLGGRYRLDARIGRGGMSTVYRAYDTVLERPVAIKLMHHEIAGEDDHLERFRREARAVARLSHPHIVNVIDAGECSEQTACPYVSPGTPYIVLEHVEGETLKELIRRNGRLEIATALAYTLQIARALACAHDHDIVHRDVKPQNVLLGEDATVKITDFGIARTLAEEGLTIDGRVLGTTDYVSPEQALGQEVTGQSDIYSLGVVLYEMLAGSVPFKGDTPVAVAMMHVREEVPDVQLSRPEASAATAAVVERATSRSTDRRYRSMAAMIADLEEALAIESARTHPSAGEVTAVLRTLPSPARRLLPWRMRHPARWAASIGLLAAIVALTLIAAAEHAHRGTGVAYGVHAGTRPVFLAQTAASSYNPFGTGPEDERQTSNAIDGDPNTTWSTEHYYEDRLSKPGLGLTLDAAPGVIARTIEIQTPTPGFTATVYGSTGFTEAATSGESSPSAATPSSASSFSTSSGSSSSSSGGSSSSLQVRGWTKLSSPATIGTRTTLAINPSGLTFRYYLVWITALPPGRNSAEIAEVTLLR